MTTKTLGLGALALALLAPASQAQSPAPAKVGIINIQSAIIATKDGEKARADLQAKLGPRAKELEARGAEIQKLTETLQKGANTQSQEQKDKLAREIDEKKKRLQWDTEDLNSEAQQEEQKMVNAIGNKMLVIIDKYAKEKGFTLILDVSPQQSPVLWAAEGVEVSRDIVERYDKEYGSAATSAAPAATPAKPPATAAKPPAAPPKK